MFGVKQGGPIATICFILAYQIFLNELVRAGVPTSAFVDDATIVATSKAKAQHFASPHGSFIECGQNKISRLSSSYPPPPSP